MVPGEGSSSGGEFEPCGSDISGCGGFVINGPVVGCVGDEEFGVSWNVNKGDEVDDFVVVLELAVWALGHGGGRCCQGG